MKNENEEEMKKVLLYKKGYEIRNTINVADKKTENKLMVVIEVGSANQMKDITSLVANVIFSFEL